MPDGVFHVWLQQHRRQHHLARFDRRVEIDPVTELIAEAKLFQVQVGLQVLDLAAQRKSEV